MTTANLLKLLIFLTTVTFAILTTTPPPISECPDGCTCTNNNLTVDCSNRGLLRLPPMSGLITELDLSGNLLGPMINGSFEHLRHLQEVNLSGNRLIRLQLCTFTGLLHLRHVDLHGNGMRSLPVALFADNGEVEYLDLSHNDLDALPDLLLHSLPRLKVLNVSHNQATNLKLGLRFQLLSQLTVLDLSHNPFRNASHDAFEMAESWDHTVPRSLDLSYCQLENMDPNTLTNVPGLRNLSLAGNGLLSFAQVVEVLKLLEDSGIESIDLSHMNITNPALFSEVRLMALKALDLSGNKIAAVPASTFGNIRSLRYLDMSENWLTRLDVGFEDLINLLELNISHCRLESFKGSAVGRMQRLTTLDLSNNHLLDADEVDLSPLNSLQILDLSFNSLQSVVLPGNNQQLVSLNYASNALSSLPSMSNMRSLQFFNVHDNNLQTLGPFLFTEATNIVIANFSRNDLTNVDHRAFLPDSPKIIDLSQNFLTDTEYFSWKSTREVYLQNNSLNDIDQQTFYGMDRLEVLDLRFNNLSFIHDQTFKFLTNLTTLRLSHNALGISDFLPLLQWLESLEVLDLGDNAIEVIDSSSFQRLLSLTSLSLRKNRLETVPVELFEVLENLKEVDISGNPFHCACELLPLQAWLHDTKVKIKQRFDLNVTNMCVSPKRHAGKLVTQYTVGQFECNTTLLYVIVFGSIGAFGILAGIIASLVCHYYQRRRKDKYGDEVERLKRKHKTDADKRKSKGIKKVDLVRVSKKDPYSKQELVNGWVTSKQLVPKKHANPDGRLTGSSHKQGPPRPPWPPRDSGRSRRESRERQQEYRDREGRRRESRDAYYAQRESPERRIRSVSQTVPMQHPQRPRDYERSRQLPHSAWRDRYYDDTQPMVVRLPPGRWENVEMYPTWGQPSGAQRMYPRESARYSTLPSPSMLRFQPYGPYYPYRHRRPSEAEYRHGYQARTLPHPPPPDQSRLDFYLRDERAQYRGRDDRGLYYEEARNPRNVEPYNYRTDSQQKYSREEREGARDAEIPPNMPQVERNTQDPYKPNRQNGNSPHIYSNGPTHPERTGSADQAPDGVENANADRALRRGTSDQQIHRRDSDYRNAMDNPIGPKAASSPLLAEEKTSDWL